VICEGIPFSCWWRVGSQILVNKTPSSRHHTCCCCCCAFSWAMGKWRGLQCHCLRASIRLCHWQRTLKTVTLLDTFLLLLPSLVFLPWGFGFQEMTMATKTPSVAMNCKIAAHSTGFSPRLPCIWRSNNGRVPAAPCHRFHKNSPGPSIVETAASGLRTPLSHCWWYMSVPENSLLTSACPGAE